MPINENGHAIEFVGGRCEGFVMDSGTTKVDFNLPSKFFKPWEKTIDSWKSAINWIDIVQEYSRNRSMVWRGVSNADYPLHSSLYRNLYELPKKVTEDELSRYENKFIDLARKRWRFDGIDALELMAQLQHFGAPTRLIDVTYNPLIGLWFACRDGQDGIGAHDGRLFAFDVSKRDFTLDGNWNQSKLPWSDKNLISKKQWHSTTPQVWRPPSYIERIAAQNAAFLIGGVPSVQTGQNAVFRKGPGDGSTMGTWKIDEVQAVTSVFIRMTALNSRVNSRSTPTYTFRIKRHQKELIRDVLDKQFGINVSALFPEVSGMAQFIKEEAYSQLGIRHPSRSKLRD